MGGTAKDAKSAARTLQFYIKTSKKTKMRSVHTIIITFKGMRGITKEGPATSCMQAKEDGSNKNGLFWITDTVSKKVTQEYCNQEDHGGGWHLLMKNKVGTRLNAKANEWTDTRVLNTGNPNESMNIDAKYAAYKTLPISELF